MHMQLINKTLLVTSMFVFAACGNKSNDSAVLQEKKAKLEALKKQHAEVENNILALEKELAKLDPAAAKEEKTKLVTLVTLTPQPFVHQIDLQGKVEAVNISYVTPRNGGGQVKQIFVKKGDNVNKGQLLLKLDDALIKQSVAAGEQSLETIKTQLSLAKTLYNKYKNLWDQNIGTEIQVITAKSNVETLENQLKAAQEQVKISKEQLQFTNVYSDVSGVIDALNVRVGEAFTGFLGVGPQITIVNTTDLKVTTQIPENYLNKVKVGSKIHVVLPDTKKTIQANITVASKLIDANSRSFYVEAKIPADNDFHPNQIALVKIQDYATTNSLVVPVNTLQSDEKGKYIMVAVKENNKLVAHKKPVSIGEMYNNQLEIISGLQPGDAVIVDGFQSLYDGQLLTTNSK